MKNIFMWGDESFNDVYEGKQSKLNHKKYILEKITGIIDIGKKRKTQEDSLLLMENQGVKLMAIADGMGGMMNGEIASNYALLTIGLWFQKRNLNENASELKVLEELKELLIAINTEIYRVYSGGTTLVLAIKLKNNTITINIGDSRIYIYDKKGLIQITSDHSLAWDDYLQGKIKNKDDIRFCYYNNLINSYLGDLYMTGEDKIISNNDYQDMILTSDGITDLISDEKMLEIIKNNPNSYEEDILNYVLYTTDYNFNLSDDIFRKETEPGKDNASIIVYRKNLVL